MPDHSARRPTLATWSLIVALSALASPLIAYSLPTGDGEAGFARAFTHLAIAIAVADVLTIAWSALAALSLRQREGTAGQLVLGFLALIASMGLCLAPISSISLWSALTTFLIGVGPAIVAGAFVFRRIRS